MRTDHNALNASFFDDDDTAPSPAKQHAFAADLQASVKRRLGEHEMRYDDAPVTDGEYEAAKDAFRAEVPTEVVTVQPLPSTCARMAYFGELDSLLAKAGCCPDGYMMLGNAELALVNAAIREGTAVEVIAAQLVELRREGTLYVALKASRELGELTRKHEALLADLEGLRSLVTATLKVA